MQSQRFTIINGKLHFSVYNPNLRHIGISPFSEIVDFVHCIFETKGYGMLYVLPICPPHDSLLSKGELPSIGWNGIAERVLKGSFYMKTIVNMIVDQDPNELKVIE